MTSAEQKSGIEIAKAVFQTKRKMDNNDNTASENANVAVSGVQTLNWNSSVNNWMDYENENHRDSGTSSSDGIPTSDAPTSSTTSTNISIFDTLLQAIDRNEISNRLDLETRLKIMNWLCATEEINKVVSLRLSFYIRISSVNSAILTSTIVKINIVVDLIDVNDSESSI
ncbi:hypothetical protein LOAG_10147 [Loa loa]|uniref:Uncharacterized protein n=1 Tax=Loa loa TaxID=7209 RepID=A0A1S0TQL9_LOALO|nr:hypothetical protein LOAG_10147 [Loa loa]EFO18347.2 hypothetical protein LOAG_10147 [Loa loa]